MADYMKDDYTLKYSDQIDISLAEEAVKNLELETSTDVVVGGVNGTVNTTVGACVPGATVKLFDLDYNPIMHTLTDEKGNYLLSNVPVGQYLIFAVKDGYNLSTEQTIVVLNEMEFLDPIIIDEFPAGNRVILYGTVVGEDGVELGDVTVDLYANDVLKYTTKSADDGEYIVYGLEPGKYTILAYTDVLKSQDTLIVSLVEDTPYEQDIKVYGNRDNLNGTINGIITDKTTSDPIENAFVALYKIVDGKETLITGTVTDEKGRYFFGDIETGTYMVKAIANKGINKYS